MVTKEEILTLVEKYYLENKKETEFTKVPVTGKVYDQDELKNLVSASLDGWWTEGEWTDLFEKKIKDFLGVKAVLSTNSGSSANLVALKTLTSSKLKDKRISPGDEIITVAGGFPTTINPILDVGAIPVFLDVDLATHNIDTSMLEDAVSSKTKAVMIAHTLGNPYNLKDIRSFCDRHNLWLIEDNCDAFGSKYNGEYTGTYGDLATLSFYPAHHITTAEGGAVLINSLKLYKIARSFRDWGRDCWCPSGKDNTCNNRFGWKLGELPKGYDHKYIYSEKGYNLKMTDLQASLGVAQIDKLQHFIEKRKENFNFLYNKLKEFDNFFILPEATPSSDPSWFGFLLTIKSDSLDRTEFTKYLNEKGIGTRLLFGGNVIKQPYFVNYNYDYRVVGELKNTDKIMHDSFWIGIYQGLDKEHLDYVYECFKEYLEGK